MNDTVDQFLSSLDQLEVRGTRATADDFAAVLAEVVEAPTAAVLDALGYDVRTSSVECCGMAGSFGYKSEYYELSMKVGEALREQFGADERKDRAVVASGTSCQEQLKALLGEPVWHPIQLIAPNPEAGPPQSAQR